MKEQQALQFVSTHKTAGYRLSSFECAQETQAQSESSSLIRRCEMEFLRDFVSEFGCPVSLKLTNQINSDLPKVLLMSLLFPGRNLKIFPRFLDPHFSPTEVYVVSVNLETINKHTARSTYIKINKFRMDLISDKLLYVRS